MTTIARTEEGKEKRPLQPIAANGWRGGLGNLLSKEMGQWWRTRMWWVQLIIWVFILNGVSTLVMIEDSKSADMTIVQQLTDVVQVFLLMGATAISIGVVSTVQGAIVGEKQLGTAAWVMSKPASRQAFILAKTVAHGLGFLVTAVLVPAIILFSETRLLVVLPLSLPSFLGGVSLLALSMLFYLALTLMLGTLFNNRGPITGIGVALVLSGLFMKGMFPPIVLAVTPWLLPDISAAVTLGAPLPDYWYVSVVISSCWVVVFTAVALWRFAREEF